MSIISSLFVISSFLFYKGICTTTCTGVEECASTTVSDDYIYCQGYESCELSTITSVYTSSCTGDHACVSSTISLTGGWPYVFSCDGYYSCQSADITNTGGQTICSGTWACKDSTLDLRIGYCRGWASCYGATIAVQDLDCSGPISCHSATIAANPVYGYYGVECRGEQSCYNADITAQRVTGDAWRSLHNADITGVDGNGHTALTCDGEQSCLSLTVDWGVVVLGNVYVDVYGYQAAYYMTMYSGDLSGTFSLDFYGYDSTGGTNIYCEAGNTCNVNCYGQSCDSGSILYCESSASCTLYCDDSSYCLTQQSYSAATLDKAAEKEKRINMRDEYTALADKAYEKHYKNTKGYKRHGTFANIETAVINKSKNGNIIPIEKNIFTHITALQGFIIGCSISIIIFGILYCVFGKNKKSIDYTRLPTTYGSV